MPFFDAGSQFLGLEEPPDYESLKAPQQIDFPPSVKPHANP
jgi:hypothetical protein